MILRRFEAADGAAILSWIKDEREFRMWSADRFGDYPSAPEKIAAHHEICSQSGSFFPLTAVDEVGNVVGHLILRYTDDEKTEVRFGFVIVDSSKSAQDIVLALVDDVGLAEILDIEDGVCGCSCSHIHGNSPFLCW